MRYLIFIAVSLAGIYVSDALYQDMADYLLKTNQTDKIAKYLLMKWAAVSFFIALVIWSIMRLGFANAQKSKKREDDRRKSSDPYLERLEKFKNIEKLKSRSDLLISSHKKDTGDSGTKS